MLGSAAEAVHRFWFGEPARDLEALKVKIKRWYMGGPEMDAEIAQRFAGVAEEALAGKHQDWAETPRGRIALVIVLDQFPRNLFRGSARAFAGAATAERLATEAFDAGLERLLSVEERNFLIMPLLHSESLALQERSVAVMAEHVATAPEALRPIFGMGIEQSRKYRDVIARFGRFPHRNEALGRASTPEEIEFLKDWAERAPPSGAKGL